jgi:hypothetical protein
MGEKPLVKNQLDDSVRLIQKLDLDGNSPTNVVWYLYEDIEEWRLLIAGPVFDALLPKQEAVAYGKLIDAITSIAPTSISISDLKLVPTDLPLIQALHFLVRTDPKGIVGAYFSNTTINGIFIKNMVVFRSS